MPTESVNPDAVKKEANVAMEVSRVISRVRMKAEAQSSGLRIIGNSLIALSGSSDVIFWKAKSSR